MDNIEAKKYISKHGSGYLNTDDELKDLDNLRDRLHEYGEIKNEYFYEIIKSLFILSDEISQNNKIDRELIHSIWYICTILRSAIENERDPTFYYNTPVLDKDRIAIWLKIIESIMLNLLNGFSKEDVFTTIASCNNFYKLELKWSFLIPTYIKKLENSFYYESAPFFDDEISICEYLGEFKEEALIAMPVLKKIANSHKSQELKEFAKKTIHAIQKAE